MYCPECRSEYRYGIMRCATCDVALVETVPPIETAPEAAVRFGSSLVGVLRRTDVKVIVLAVVVGHALAAGIGSVISAIVSTIGLFLRPSAYPGFAWESAVRATVFTLTASVILWSLTAVGTLMILVRVIRSLGAEKNDES